MRKIKLTQGMVATVDDEDFEWLNYYKWYAVKPHRSNTFYAVTKIGRKTTYIHRLIINTPANKITDHKNRNGLDNRKINLRICDYSDNFHNAIVRKNCKSGLKGVS